jgi:general secretion pathway protein M
MSAATETLTRTLAPWRERWRALGASERRALSVAAWVVGAALLWLLAVAPAWRSVAAAPARLDQIDAQLQQMQRLAGETRALRGAPSIGSSQAQSAVKAATDALGAAARLTLTGERASVTFTNVSGAQLRDWLTEVRGAGRARPTEATLTRSAQGYSGNVVLLLPGSTP